MASFPFFLHSITMAIRPIARHLINMTLQTFAKLLRLTGILPCKLAT